MTEGNGRSVGCCTQGTEAAVRRRCSCWTREHLSGVLNQPERNDTNLAKCVPTAAKEDRSQSTPNLIVRMPSRAAAACLVLLYQQCVSRLASAAFALCSRFPWEAKRTKPPPGHTQVTHTASSHGVTRRPRSAHPALRRAVGARVRSSCIGTQNKSRGRAVSTSVAEGTPRAQVRAISEICRASALPA